MVNSFQTKDLQRDEMTMKLLAAGRSEMYWKPVYSHRCYWMRRDFLTSTTPYASVSTSIGDYINLYSESEAGDVHFSVSLFWLFREQIYNLRNLWLMSMLHFYVTGEPWTLIKHLLCWTTPCFQLYTFPLWASGPLLAVFTSWWCDKLSCRQHQQLDSSSDGSFHTSANAPYSIIKLRCYLMSLWSEQAS